MYHAPRMTHTIGPIGALRLSLLCLVWLVVSCRSGIDEEVEPEPEATAIVLEELALEDSTSEATAPPAAPLVLEARTPVELAAELDPTAANLLVDLQSLRQWAATIPGVSSAEDRVADMVAEAVSSQAKRILGLGGTPDVAVDPTARAIGISIGSDGLAVVSDGSVSARDGRSTRTAAGLYRLEFGRGVQLGSAFPSTLPTDSFFAAWGPAVDAFPPTLAESLDFLTEAGGGALGIGVRGDGSIAVSIAGELDQLSNALGRGQAFASQMVGQLNSLAAPEFQPLVGYANRVVQSLFSQISLAPAPDGVVVSVAPPRCGGPMRGLLAAAVLITLADAAAEDERTAPRPFVAMDGFVSDGCGGTIEGPAGSIPADLLRIGSPVPGSQSMVVVIDLAAVLRRGLPRGFGLLPFELDATMLESAFSGRPIGLRGIGDEDGHVVYASERTAGSGAPVHRALLLPPGMRTFLPPDSGIDTLRPVPLVEHVAYVSPAILARERLGEEPAAHWVDLHQLLPAGSYAAALLGPGLVRPWSDWLGGDDPAHAWVSDADGAVIWVGPTGFGARLHGVTNPPTAERVREHFPTLLGRIHRGEDADARLDQRANAVAAALAQISVRTTADGIELTFDGELTPVLAAVIRVGLPMLVGRDARRVGIPGAFQLPR